MLSKYLVYPFILGSIIHWYCLLDNNVIQIPTSSTLIGITFL